MNFFFRCQVQQVTKALIVGAEMTAMTLCSKINRFVIAVISVPEISAFPGFCKKRSCYFLFALCPFSSQF